MIEDLIRSEALAAERNKDAPLRADIKVTRGHGRSKTLQVRLNPDELAALTALADQRGIPVSTLARDLLIAQLDGDSATTQAVLARIRADLDTLAAAVA